MTRRSERPDSGGGRASGPGTEPADPGQDTRFRATLTRVLLVQVATLALLWLLQATYHM